MRDLGRRRAPGALLVALAGSAALASPALAQDTAPPVSTATFAAPQNGNGSWRLTAPQTLRLAATDDVAVAKLQYSLDGGANYIDAPVIAGPSVTANVPFTEETNVTLRYRAVDSAGNVSRGATTNTTLNQAAAAGATAVRLASTAGRGPGDSLLIDTGAGQETVTIATIVTPAPPSPAPNVTLTTPLANAHAANAAVAGTAFYSTVAVQIDTKAPGAIWGTQPTTLGAAAAAGDTGVRLASTAGRAVGDTLQLDQGAGAETVKIASLVTPAPATGPNVTLAGALTKPHLSGSAVFLPSIVDGKILQSQTLTPLRTDPRLRDASDTVANGAGGAAIRRMELDGQFIVPKTVALNRLTAGKHTHAVSVQDAAGNVAKYTNTFTVTTSFADLATVIDQLADNALRTTLNGATAVGGTGLRLQTPFGVRAGQTLVVDSGDSQETVTIAKVLVPPPRVNTTVSAAAAAGDTRISLASYTQNGATGTQAATSNGPVIGEPIVIGTGSSQELVTVKRHLAPPLVELSAPLKNSHAAGTATSLVNVILSAPLTKTHATGVAIAQPRPIVAAAKATQLKGLLADAKAKADASDTPGAIAALQSFVTAAGSEAVLTSSGQALIAQVSGTPVDTTGTGVTVGAADPGAQALRVFNNPIPFRANPNATYKILISGRAGGFRHQSIVDYEWMIQQLGEQHGFDVEIWDPNIAASPGRQAPAGVSLPTSPFMDLDTLKQYKTIVMNSTVGINGTATLNATEFANLQAYIRQGGGIVPIHGGTDSMQNVPWYMDLIGAGFTSHGSNAGGILIDTEAGGHVELVNADPAHQATQKIPNRFFTVEELYNTNRDPVDLGIVHPLVYENEDSLVGQIGYSTGALHNTDRHGMVWCRNFEGGRSFSSTLGHNWQFATDEWFRDMILNAIQWTSGKEYANCVTFNEVRDLLAAASSGGNVTAAANIALSAALESADTAYRAGDDAGAAAHAKTFVAQAKRVANAGADGGKALLELQSKGVELVNWMSGDGAAPPTPTLQSEPVQGGVGGTVPATLSLSLGAPATFGAFTPGVDKDYAATTTADVISTAGNAALSVSDPGHLSNGAFSLPEPLRVAFSKSAWTAPTSNERVTVTFNQLVKRTDALRTGSYSRTVTFTLSTTAP
ncbi:ThuA domain-containing protein [Solirubrobacter phytolaccae]|uniref:ThuA domain-containing protein n=1 Tax=Solirubrobacter phytolaccae TaxID=1404360 RepID=A0A9X3NA72_9ACTN|nr:ThuA domain-containing protein [Solirubrobacter phytolaccae]MDA0182236.1 ThuA domain-containing protein [Solirubrobacter phytolaccae]